jgi:hypothetical protein
VLAMLDLALVEGVAADGDGWLELGKPAAAG